MAPPTEHIHHLTTRSTHMDMPSSNRSERTENCDDKLKDAQEEIERIQEQREKLGRKILELEKLTSRKQAFVSQQLELTEKLTSSLTLIDRALLETRNEAEDIEQCRACFAAHLDKIQEFNPANWTHDNMSEKLASATMAIDLATDEFDQVAAHFEGSRVGAIFGRSSKRVRANKHHGASSEFLTNLRNGFAFNLPVLVLAGVILLVYLLK
jgi:chromosome segregation ATPase